VNYDADGELSAVAPFGNAGGAVNYSYSYDGAGNMLSAQAGNNIRHFTYNKVNQLTTAGTSYDVDGNLSRLDGRSYEWLKSISVPVRLTAPEWRLNTIHYDTATFTQWRYDGLGRRFEIDGNAGGGNSDKRYLWCGSRVCEQHDLSAATVALPGGPVTKRYFDEGVQINGAPYFYTFDGLGSVVQLVDKTGAVRAQYQYDPYGNRIQTGGDLTTDIGYTGLFQDPQSGLALARAREYAPSVGRWLSRDPLGEFGDVGTPPVRNEVVDADELQSPDRGVMTWFSGTNVNLYNYVLNDPLDQIDPSGLQGVHSAPGESFGTCYETCLKWYATRFGVIPVCLSIAGAGPFGGAFTAGTMLLCLGECTPNPRTPGR
jgi:RHS repeat-associated protein